ncbi:Histone-lysine N-methyltransferase SETMAR [Dufourea novaeangliae]|uniref:Histone-lysine N-methyltransferase SETMAR n=1 Tax=Dufourea novaeangliae TaxID=178035 RepID=A0A154PQP3_DUFNO|nr:Histone-lysine N-methyltransferase SETMAR [Dufourea novaeangliae]
MENQSERFRYILLFYCRKGKNAVHASKNYNARVHTSVLTMAKFNELKYELLEHPAYSPDLAPSDYYLFPNLKKFLARKRFTSNDEAIAAVNGYFAYLPESHFNDGIELLEKHWNKCI